MFVILQSKPDTRLPYLSNETWFTHKCIKIKLTEVSDLYRNILMSIWWLDAQNNAIAHTRKSTVAARHHTKSEADLPALYKKYSIWIYYKNCTKQHERVHREGTLLRRWKSIRKKRLNYSEPWRNLLHTRTCTVHVFPVLICCDVTKRTKVKLLNWMKQQSECESRQNKLTTINILEVQFTK